MKEKILKEIFEWSKAIIFAVVIVFLVQLFVVPSTVVGPSMNPTFNNGDVLLMRVTEDLEKGDVIAFKTSFLIEEKDIELIPVYKRLFTRVGNQKSMIKRVIAQAGDKICIKDSQVYVNDEVLTEPYIKGSTYPDVEAQVIPQGQLFVMGDNRENSNDSRLDLGLVPIENVTGRLIIRMWPLNSFGTVE